VTSVSVAGAPKQYAWKAAGTNKSVKLSAAVLPIDAADKSVVWRVDNTKIATVKTGELTFKGVEGTVRVTATSVSNPEISAYKDIKVVKNVTKIDTPLKTINIQSGKKLTIPYVIYDGSEKVKARLAWKSSNLKIATVSKTGLVKAAKNLKQGRATVTAVADNGKSLKLVINVSAKAVKLQNVEVTAPVTLDVGKTKKLTIKLEPQKSTGIKVAFKSSKSKGLYVDKAGLLTAKKPGEYTITIKVGTKTVKKKVTVAEVVASDEKVKVLVDSLAMRKGYSSDSESRGKAQKDKIYQLTAKTKDGKWGRLKSNGCWIYLKKGYTQKVY
jgi:uncharacterized protein YjdB